MTTPTNPSPSERSGDRAQADQLDAARRDTEELIGRLSVVVKAVEPGRGWSGIESGHASPEARALILSALTSTVRCRHLQEGGPQPAITMLAVHATDCVPCSRTFRRPPDDEADRCDFACGARGVETFTPVALQLGPYMILGDACARCAELLRLDDGA